jgi:hypothetical protein
VPFSAPQHQVLVGGVSTVPIFLARTFFHLDNFILKLGLYFSKDLTTFRLLSLDNLILKLGLCFSKIRQNLHNAR